MCIKAAMVIGSDQSAISTITAGVHATSSRAHAPASAGRTVHAAAKALLTRQSSAEAAL
tara:strand:- start:2559 stop:2735 length:177 start_codon:yes stop_codon:yes gene_type:complete